jgi:hypothetical protein
VLGPQEGLVLVSLLGTIGPPFNQVLGPQEGVLDFLLTRCWASVGSPIGYCLISC